MCVSLSQEAVRRCERRVDSQVTYSSSLSAASEWISTVHDQLVASSDVTGDVLSVSARLQHVNELAHLMPQGRTMLDTCVTEAAVVSDSEDFDGQQSVLDDVGFVQAMWERLKTDLSESQQSLSDAVQRWNDYEEHWRSLDEWLTNMETSVKREILISDVDEIEPLVKSYQVSGLYS